MRISDWSSDVCSSDLESRQALRKGWTNPVRAVIKRRFGGWARTAHVGEGPMAAWRSLVLTIFPEMFPGPLGLSLAGKALERSDERCAGKECVRTCRYRWSSQQ